MRSHKDTAGRDGEGGDDLNATMEMCKHCFDILIHQLTGSSPPLFRSSPNSSCPLFVTWDKIYYTTKNNYEYHLRGCIGTLSPRNLNSSIGDYALTSALKDSRFDPVSLEEVKHLRVAVSLLVKYEECSNCFDWTVGTHGIIINFHDGTTARNATYLPEVALEQKWDQKEAVLSLIRKSGHRGIVSQELLLGVKTTRYQSSKYRLTYDQYVELVNCDPVESALIASKNSGQNGFMKALFQR